MLEDSNCAGSTGIAGLMSVTDRTPHIQCSQQIVFEHVVTVCMVFHIAFYIINVRYLFFAGPSPRTVNNQYWRL